MADFLAQLPGPIDLRMVLADASLADTLASLLIAKGARSGVPRVRAIDHNDTRLLKGTLLFEGASKDDVIAQVAAINALLRGGTTLTLQSRNASYSVSLNVLAGSRIAPPLSDELFEAKSTSVGAVVPFSWPCEPYAYGPETTLATLTNQSFPGFIALSIPGDYPTPLKVDLADGGSGSNTNKLWLSLFPDQSVAFADIFQAYPDYFMYMYGDLAVGNPGIVTMHAGKTHGLSSGQYVTFSGTGNTGLDGTPVKVTVISSTQFSVPVNVTIAKANCVYWLGDQISMGCAQDANCFYGYDWNAANLDYYWMEYWDRLLPAGTYRVLARTRTEAGQYTLGFGPSAGVGVLMTRSAVLPWVADEIGRVRLPYYRTFITNKWAVPRFWYVCGSGGHVHLDWWAVLPTSWGWMEYDYGGSGGTYKVSLDYEGVVYDNDVATLKGRSSGFSALGDIYMAIFPATAYSSAHGSKVWYNGSVKCVPRYALWR